MSAPGRLLAILTLTVTIAALLAQGVVSYRLVEGSSVVRLLWVMAAYFTVLVNLGVALGFALVLVRGRSLTAGWHGGLVLWIGTVGVIYHAVLAGIWAPQGLGWWADQGLHTAVPVLSVLWWLAFAPKSPLDRWHPWRWALVPLVYCAYALLRGQMTGAYPYPFIDAGVLGAGRTALNVMVLSGAFVGAGYLLIGIARVLDRQAKPS